MNLQQKIQVYFRWNVRAKKECLQQLSLYEQVLKNPVFPQNTYKKGDMVQLTTNRESAILLGLPPSAIEGVFVSEAVENNEEQLQTIQAIFPRCYICNLQGKIIKQGEKHGSLEKI